MNKEKKTIQDFIKKEIPSIKSQGKDVKVYERKGGSVVVFLETHNVQGNKWFNLKGRKISSKGIEQFKNYTPYEYELLENGVLLYQLVYGFVKAVMHLNSCKPDDFVEEFKVDNLSKNKSEKDNG